MLDIDTANHNFTENLFQPPRVEIVCEYCEAGVNPENAYGTKEDYKLNFCSDTCAEDFEIDKLASHQKQIGDEFIKFQGGCQTVC